MLIEWMNDKSILHLTCNSDALLASGCVVYDGRGSLEVERCESIVAGARKVSISEMVWASVLMQAGVQSCATPP